MSQQKSKSKSKSPPKVIELVFHENLIKSLNQMYEKQNLELLTAISDEKAIPLADFLKFSYDEPKVIIPLQK
jgi:hypothetical protein